MSEPSAFPLNAEQIVRGAGHILTLWLNRTRRADEPKLATQHVIYDLAKAMGVPLPIENGSGQYGGWRLLPYGSPITAEPTTSSAPPQNGGSREG